MPGKEHNNTLSYIIIETQENALPPPPEDHNRIAELMDRGGREWNGKGALPKFIPWTTEEKQGICCCEETGSLAEEGLLRCCWSCS